MSLNAEEREQTRTSLAVNLDRSGLRADEVAEALAVGPGRVAAVLAMTAAAHPADVWLVRDFLDEAIRLRGGQPVPYAALPEHARAAAEQWFGLRPLTAVRAAVSRLGGDEDAGVDQAPIG